MCDESRVSWSPLNSSRLFYFTNKEKLNKYCCYNSGTMYLTSNVVKAHRGAF